jgi:peroxiredoxin
MPSGGAERVNEELAACHVLEADGKPWRVGDTWRDGPGLVVFVRQFGCVACAMQTTELSPRLELLAQLGVATLMIGTGPIESLVAFVAREGLDGRSIRVATDPERKAYRAAGMVHSVWGTWGPAAWPGFVRGTMAGHVNRIEGDPNQQGGALLVDRDGLVWFTRRTAFLGDLVSGNELVDQALRLAARRTSDVP